MSDGLSGGVVRPLLGVTAALMLSTTVAGAQDLNIAYIPG